LNTRCSFQFIVSRIPPHEHGRYGLKLRIAATYKENVAIKKYDKNKPITRTRGIRSNAATISSASTTAGGNQAWNAVRKGESPTWILKFSKSRILLNAV
jgi:hypothetical protein